MIGAYCHHLHHLGDCPTCLFQGIAVGESVSKAFTIHGTHRATVRDSVIHNHRGAAIYVENGSEMENRILYNVITCEYMGARETHACPARRRSEPGRSRLL